MMLLVLAPIFYNTNCQKLKVNRLKANYHFNQANNLFRDNRYRQAIKEYEAALKYDPNLGEAYRFLGESYKSLYRPSDEGEKNQEMAQKALKALNKAYEIDPANREIIYSLGDMYDKLRNFKEAEKLYLKIIKMDPTDMSNYYVVAEFYKRYAGGSKGKEGEENVEGGKAPFQKAEEMYLRRIETDPENPQGYAYVAQFYEGITPKPEFDKANYFHEKRALLEPKNPAAWLSKGVNRWSKAYRMPTLPKQERLALARDSLQALKKANELDSQYPEPYSWLSVLYKSLLAKLEPGKAKRYNSLGDMYADKFKELRKRQLEREKLEKELKGQGVK